MKPQPSFAFQLIVSCGLLSGRLAPLKSLIASKPLFPILENFLFELEANFLNVVASDLQVFLSTEVAVETKSDAFSCCVPAKLLMDLLAKLPEQPLRLCFDQELSTLTVLSYSGTYELPLIDSVDWPESSEATPGISFGLPVEQLAHALGHTTFATATDELRPNMTCVYIESAQGLRFIATDGHRIVKVERPNAGIESCKALLPRKSAALLTKLLADSQGLASIEITPTTIVFMLSAYILITRQIEGDYPETGNLFVYNPFVLDCEKSPVISALKTALLFTDKATGQVRFDLEEPDHFEISAENLDWNRRANEVIENAQYAGDRLIIGFNGKLLLELLEHVDGPLVQLDFNNPMKAVFLHEKSVDSDEVTVTSLMMPMALFDLVNDSAHDYGNEATYSVRGNDGQLKDITGAINQTAKHGWPGARDSPNATPADTPFSDGKFTDAMDYFGASEMTVSGTDVTGKSIGSVTLKRGKKGIKFQKKNGDPVD